MLGSLHWSILASLTSVLATPCPPDEFNYNPHIPECTYQNAVLNMTPVGCPEDWIQYKESCYYIINEERTMEHAIRHCRTEVAGLLVPDTYEELMFIYNLTDGNWTWIGLERVHKDYGENYADGPVSWNTDFSPYMVRECAAMINFFAIGTKIYWLECDETAHFVCERNSTVAKNKIYYKTYSGK